MKARRPYAYCHPRQKQPNKAQRPVQNIARVSKWQPKPKPSTSLCWSAASTGRETKKVKLRKMPRQAERTGWPISYRTTTRHQCLRAAPFIFSGVPPASQTSKPKSKPSYADDSKPNPHNPPHPPAGSGITPTAKGMTAVKGKPSRRSNRSPTIKSVTKNHHLTQFLPVHNLFTKQQPTISKPLPRLLIIVIVKDIFSGEFKQAETKDFHTNPE
ncbi:unnamed protein product [Cuscuta epithymum]|uniref:Uncharacterized protein n=1 Tax=Cuscuta epithymum TaxID=186058 RepID=A0AAV0FBI5_9ASTE|nr:unnamed protein product [Cuscuta epithymum]